MSSPQNLEQTISLLQRERLAYPILELLFPIEGDAKATFWGFEAPSVSNTKEHILDIYETRATFEVKRLQVSFPPGAPILGYDTLIPNLRKTKHQHICISSLENQNGTFFIFSDFEGNELLGVLLSPW